MRKKEVNKTLIAGAVALISLASGSAFAQTYVGVNLGDSHANHGCGAAEATTLISSCDKSDFAYKLYGGYQLPGTDFAGELSYANLGKFKGSGTGASSEAKDSYWGIGGAYRPSFGQGWAALPASAPPTPPARWTTTWERARASTPRTAGIRTMAWA